MSYPKFLVVPLVFVALGSPLQAAEDNVDDALQALLRQADYWENNQRPDLARQALERYLISQPDSPRVLYRLAMMAREEGREEEAERWTRRLRSLSPSDPRLEEIERVDQEQNISQLELERVRRLASEGRYEDAIAGYREIMGGSTPSRTLAPEYYQTMAGTSRGWSEARQELARLNELHPEDQNIARALAEVLTYRENTRREGIDRLNAMVANDPDLRAPLREALLWLEAGQSDRSRYERYMNQWPDDSDVMRYFEQRAVVERRSAGFVALDQGRVSEAEQAFRDTLRVTPNDADAQAGLGLVFLRREQFVEAEQWLSRAMNAAPSRRSEWELAHTSASYYARLQRSEEGGASINFENELARVRAARQRMTGDTTDAQLLEGDILRRMGRIEEAEALYREILRTDSDNEGAQIGLVAVLRQRAESEPPFTAETTLRSALRLRPRDVWARADLARLLYEEGNYAEAERVAEPLVNFDASNEERYAGVLLYAGLEDWRRVETIVSGIHPDERTPELEDIVQLAMSRQQFDRVMTLLDQDRTAEASSLLESLYGQDWVTPGMAGQIADAMFERGRRDLAMRWIQRDLSNDGEKLPSQYGAHVLVLAKLGQSVEADELLATLRRNTGQHLDERDALNQTRYGLAVIRADRFRDNGQLASAYDQLVQPLRESPDDLSLLLAMARIYSSGERHSEAQQIYDYVLQRHADNVPAMEGAINEALASGNPARAGELVSRYRLENSNNPEYLIMAAQVAHQRGDNNHALNLLSRASNLAAAPQASTMDVQQAAQSGNNPFVDNRTVSTAGGNTSLAWLPGRQPSEFYTSGFSEGAIELSAMERRIQELSSEIHSGQATRVDAGMELHVRSGETGMSQLERLEGNPMAISGTPIGNARLALELTPSLLNSGNVSESSQARFGQNAIPLAAGALGGEVSNLNTILNSIESSATNYFSAQERALLAQQDATLPEIEKQRLQAEANSARSLFDQALERNPVFEAGLQLESLSEAQQATLASYFGNEVLGTQSLSLSGESLEAFLASRQEMQNAFALASDAFSQNSAFNRPGYQRDSGLGVGLRLDLGDLALDIGSTPLGFEETNLVGGIQWQPALGNFSRLNLRLEQRPVKDSILSYAGALDPFTGRSWGGVVRRGGGVGFSMQNAEGSGFYTDLAGYQYTGNQVSSNQLIDFGIGGYVRPYRHANGYLQTGIHVGAMGFSEDLSYFTLGHGGYFSPQEFFNVSFPISLEYQKGDLNYSASFTPGYQSFTLDGNDYFPNDPGAQELLNIMAILGALPNSRHLGFSESGLGVSFQGKADYRLSRSLLMGGSIGFSNFGAFTDYSMRIYLQYTRGGWQ